jgi:ferredoxin
MKAIVNADTCVGCGLCEETCPAVFEMEGDVAVVKVDPVPDAEKDACKEAVEGCPVEAIAIEY